MNRTLYRRCNKLREATLRRCATMRAAKERKRLVDAAACGEWSVARELVIRTPGTDQTHTWTLSASPDGRHIALSIDVRWHRCGSERTIRALLARKLWAQRQAA